MKLRIRFYKILLLFTVLFYTTSFDILHPIKLTSSLIEYNPKTNSFDMECRVFIDDFTNSINNTFTSNIDLINLSKEDIKGIEDYFERYFTIMVNDKEFYLKYKSSTVFENENVFSIKFSTDALTVTKGDQFCIENKLFYEEFSFMQTNMTTIRIPSFVKENFFQAKFDKYHLLFNL